jgi:hypothetical protein
MTDLETKAKTRAIDDMLVPIAADLDQLCKLAEDEGVNIERSTTERLLSRLTELHVLEEEARKLGNQRLIGRVVKERDRTRQGLGFIPRKRKR